MLSLQVRHRQEIRKAGDEDEFKIHCRGIVVRDKCSEIRHFFIKDLLVGRENRFATQGNLFRFKIYVPKNVLIFWRSGTFTVGQVPYKRENCENIVLSID